ncbi:hypothetical protein F5X97DRAFT_291933 [Nemania serpens]|nr:hypothetical protein F5X97DRAFT_291933 [Nemania serpens]
MQAAALMTTTIEAVEPQLEAAGWKSDGEIDPKALWDLISRVFRKQESLTGLFNELLNLRVDEATLSKAQFLSRFRYITGWLAEQGVPIAPAFKAVLVMRAMGVETPSEMGSLVLEIAAGRTDTAS